MALRQVRVLLLCAVPAVASGCRDYQFTEPPPKGFEVTPLFAGMDEGATLQLTAVSGGNPVAVTWTSDNTSVLSVSPTGLVTAVGRGQPTGIIARLVADPSRTASSSITVKPLPGIGLTPGLGRTISAIAGTLSLYRIFVPAGQKTLSITTAGGIGDIDIYVRFGTIPFGQSPPDSCTNDHVGNEEMCFVENPQSGTWYILAAAFETYSGVVLTATYAQ